MEINKTIQGGIVNLTKVKEELLNQEYNNLQKYIRGEEDVELYSANKQQVEWNYDRINEDNEHPISIRKDLIDVEECNSNVCDYFVKIPVAGRYGGVKVPVNTHTDIPEDAEIGESKLYKHNGNFYINITITKETRDKADGFKGVLGIDLGLKRPVVYVTLSVADNEIQDVSFRGQEIQKTQNRYAYLRRNSTNGKKWKGKEANKVKDQLHKITTAIADKAEEENLAVAVGDLEGIQEQDKGKEMNRKLHSFPHHKFRKFLKYKCKERGVPYKEVSEAYTSQTCYKCGEKGELTPNHLICHGSKMNRDVNGAMNIAKRAVTKFETKPLGTAGAS